MQKQGRIKQRHPTIQVQYRTSGLGVTETGPLNLQWAAPLERRHSLARVWISAIFYRRPRDWYTLHTDTPPLPANLRHTHHTDTYTSNRPAIDAQCRPTCDTTGLWHLHLSGARGRLLGGQSTTQTSDVVELYPTDRGLGLRQRQRGSPCDRLEHSKVKGNTEFGSFRLTDRMLQDGGE